MDQSELLVEYDKKVSNYTDFTEKLHTLLDELLKNRGLKVHSVTGRVKQRDSFAQKVERTESPYETFTDITDITGVRIITYFADDVDRIAQVIRDEFEIDMANSVDKRDLLVPDRFGYLSLHYVISLSPTRVGLSEYKRHTGLKAEIQIRSILQHAWAEIEHDLGYKTALGVPRAVRRQFSRLAGLLEIADNEFTSIRNELTNYERDIPSQIKQTPDTVLLDKASLRAYITSNEFINKLDRKIAEFTRDGIINTLPESQFENQVASLHSLGINTVSNLDSALRKREDIILRFADDWLKKSKSKNVGQTISLL